MCTVPRVNALASQQMEAGCHLLYCRSAQLSKTWLPAVRLHRSSTMLRSIESPIINMLIRFLFSIAICCHLHLHEEDRSVLAARNYSPLGCLYYYGNLEREVTPLTVYISIGKRYHHCSYSHGSSSPYIGVWGNQDGDSNRALRCGWSKQRYHQQQQDSLFE